MGVDTNTVYDFVESAKAVKNPKTVTLPGRVVSTGRFRTHYTLSLNQAAENASRKGNEAVSQEAAVSPVLLIMIHGLGGSSFVWEPLERHLVTAPEGVDFPLYVLKYDLAGRGFSCNVPATGGRPYRYDLADFTDQLDELLAHAISSDSRLAPFRAAKSPSRIALAAHSMGAIIASFFVARSLSVKNRMLTIQLADGEFKGTITSCMLLSPAGAIDAPVGGSRGCFACLQHLFNNFCCISLLGRFVFGGTPPLGDDYAAIGDDDGPDSGLSSAGLASGAELRTWSGAWCRVSTVANGGTPLAASLARMPFTTGVQDLLQKYRLRGELAEEVPPFQTQVSVLLGRHDRTCRNVRVAEYGAIFGAENVMSEVFAGRHCWFNQEPGTAFKRITEILKMNNDRSLEFE